MQAVELVSLVRDRQFSVVCFADLPPSSSSKTRYLVRRLRLALPELRIAVGRWGPPALADESAQTLLDAGANHVASVLIESRNYFGGLLDIPRLPVPDTADAAASRLRTVPPESLIGSTNWGADSSRRSRNTVTGDATKRLPEESVDPAIGRTDRRTGGAGTSTHPYQHPTRLNLPIRHTQT